jgi:hypothetical protein
VEWEALRLTPPAEDFFAGADLAATAPPFLATAVLPVDLALEAAPLRVFEAAEVFPLALVFEAAREPLFAAVVPDTRVFALFAFGVPDFAAPFAPVL